MPKNRPEDGIQKYAADLLRLYAQHACIWHSIPNESPRSPRYANRLKQLGMLPGVADMVLTVYGKTHYLEFKSPKGRQTEAQKQFECQCRATGIPYALARSVDDVNRILDGWRALRPEWKEQFA